MSGHNDQQSSQQQTLRQEAQARLDQRRPGDLAALPPQDLQAMVHELEVQHVELEVQNEELRRAQIDLAEARNRYEDLYQYAPVGYITLSEDGLIRQVNLAATQLCARSQEALIGQRLERLLAREDRDACYIFMRETAAAARISTRELRVEMANGSLRWVNVTICPATNGSSAGSGFGVTLSDIHEQKQAQQALNESEQQYRALAASLDQRAMERTSQLQTLSLQLVQAERRERHRLAKVLHDGLQQLLVGAKFHLGVLENELQDRHDLTPMFRRVDDLILESVETSRSLAIELSPPILHQGTMAQVLEWLGRWMHDKHGLSVDVRVEPHVNPSHEEIGVLIFEVVRELLLNIVKHAQTDRATVHMRYNKQKQLHVLVADKGVGFDATSVGSSGKSGLGLAGIRQRLAALGAEIKIDSTLGQGSRITLCVPADLMQDIAATAGPVVAETDTPECVCQGERRAGDRLRQDPCHAGGRPCCGAGWTGAAAPVADGHRRDCTGVGWQRGD